MHLIFYVGYIGSSRTLKKQTLSLTKNDEKIVRVVTIGIAKEANYCQLSS